MSKDDKHPITNKIIAGVASGLILAAIFYFVPKLFQWIVSVFSWLWHYFTSSISIPHWLLWVLIGLSLATLIRLITPLLKRNQNNEPTFRMYTKDTFEGMTWRWSYDYYDRPIDIVPFCPVCDAVLVPIREALYHMGRGSGVSFYCETCKQERGEIKGGDNYYAISMIERFIDRKIRKGEWKRLRDTE